MFRDVFYKKSSKTQKVRCEICSNYCKIKPDECGICGQHKNVNGELFDLSYSVVSSLNADPIEKKPLYHFLPGSLSYSVGGFGCNMSCLNCQNYIISQYYDKISDKDKIMPESIVENALLSGCKSISWTYNEPTIHFNFAKKTSLLAKREHLKIIYVSNGYMSRESLIETLNFVDAFNIDLKSISSNFYKKVCKADLNVVLENIKDIYNSGKHLELTNLLINDYNDSKEDISHLIDFILEELGCEVPLHFSRAFPYYKMPNMEPTKEETLINALNLAKEKGLEYVYLGNVPFDNNSYCPECGELLIRRKGYKTEDLGKIEENKCKKCGKELNFILQN